MDDANRPDDLSTSVLLVEARNDFEPEPHPIGRDSDSDPHDSENGFQLLALPDGPVRLLTDDAGRATLVPIEEGAEARGAGALAPNLSPLFLAVQSAAGERLLMLATRGAAISLNGLPAPLVSVLSLGDQLVLGADLLLHVSRRVQNEPVSTPARLVGQACEVCLMSFTAESKVVVCGSCGAARHLEGEEVPAEERLECASLGPCPLCQTERPPSGGLAYRPKRSLPRKAAPQPSRSPSPSERPAQRVAQP